MASKSETTSSISGLLSGLASQHRFITFARELGQHLGISGLRFYALNSNDYPADGEEIHSLHRGKTSMMKCFWREWEYGRIRKLNTWRTTADVTSEKLRSGYGMSQQYISHKQIPKLYTSHFLLYGLPFRTCNFHPLKSHWKYLVG